MVHQYVKRIFPPALFVHPLVAWVAQFVSFFCVFGLLFFFLGGGRFYHHLHIK